MVGKSSSNEIHIIRLYDAPLKTVWDAWTDPKQAAHWWGPRGFTITTHSKDLRPGGTWVYTMHGPHGEDYPNKTVYLEVETHSKLVYDHGGNDERPPLFRVTVLFSDVNGKTKMDMTMTLPTPEAAEQTRGFIKKAGGDSTWDRLAEYLEKESTGAEKFVINRTFDAPIAFIFNLWTDPSHLTQWLPPEGLTMEFLRADIKPGGDSFFKMTDGDLLTMYATVKYLEFEKPHKLVYIQQFSDKDGNISRHPYAPTWPSTMLVSVTFTEETQDRTRINVTSECHGKITKEELETFVMGRTGMTQGWTGSFDKFQEYIGRLYC